ncbi:beta-galactosidase [Pseudokineococcus marinus]|uniref:Beta-galactosidase n=1 Tax=Pseudokineococcus marinus TaxID=351215 RepID=A0A849BJI5_9ACTN|nr:beta-galactosidase [Pseudokineococcus marinus]NNH21525.1 beta-galactosidase [Pseudokineococcus marinus]
MPDLTTPTRRTRPWPTEGLSYGGDYSPEQWPREVWQEDVRLMGEAGVNLVTLGVFAWSRLEPEPGRFDFAWLDEVMDLLHASGVRVDMATPTAAPPLWLHRAHPEVLPVDADGRRWSQGGRLGWCPSSPVFREHALRVVDALAEHVAGHPALALWHVSNELGGGNARCWCDVSAAAYQRWLAERHGTPEALDAAWGTAFWGHTATSFDQVLPPRSAGADLNPAAVLDFRRFSSDALLEHYLAEREVLERRTPGVPVTTNLMVHAGGAVADYATWAPHVDVVADDHYVVADDPRGWQELSCSADRVRGLAEGRPWLLMEHSTSTVVYQAHNRAKAPGEMLRNSLAHVARGADGALFFQWRASTAGAEQWHSAMVPHAGPDSDRFREVVELGRCLRALAEVQGSVVDRPQVALLVDVPSAWALEGFPLTSQVDPEERPLALHRALSDLGVVVDVVPPAADLRDYRAVVVPALHLVDDAAAEAVADVARRGGHVLVTHLSGIVDETARVRAGGYPGAFRDLLGVRSEELHPLQPGERVGLSDGGSATAWTELVRAVDAEVLVATATGALAGAPALTRRTLPGGGTAWYAATRPDAATERAHLGAFLAAAGVAPLLPDLPDEVEAVRRRGAGGSWLFLLNHGDVDHRVEGARGTDLLTGRHHDAAVVPAGAVVVLREEAGPAA